VGEDAAPLRVDDFRAGPRHLTEGAFVLRAAILRLFVFGILLLVAAIGGGWKWDLLPH